jgi:hypothetical protein
MIRPAEGVADGRLLPPFGCASLVARLGAAITNPINPTS